MKIEDVFKKLRPLIGNKLDLLWQEYILSDPKTQKFIEMSLRLVLAKMFGETFEQKEILLEPPPRETAEGDYILGDIFYGGERCWQLGLRENEWIQHLGIFGRSGSGKTNIVFGIIKEFLRHDKKFLLFDWKRNYRDILRNVESEILVFTAGRNVSPFYFNPLIPPECTPPAVWLKKIIEIMCHAYFLGEGVSFLLQKAFDSVYREFGVYSGKQIRYPNLQDVKEWLETYKAKGRESAWMDSALRAVGVLCFGEVGKIFNSPQSFRIDRLLERNVILELDSLTNTDKTFLIEALLLWIHHYRMGEAKRELFKHACIVEEAHHILLRKKQEASGEEAVTDIILREIRELGEAIVLVDQHPSLISKPALGNTYCTIAMNMKHRSDINMIADSVLLDSEEKKYLGMLKTGWGMVKLQGRWHKPFLVKFPLIKIEKGSFRDSDVKKAMNRFCGVIRSLIFDIRGRKGKKEVIREFKASEKKSEEKGLSEMEEVIMKDIMEFPYSAVTERYKRAGLNAYQGNKIKNSLIRKGFIEEKDIPTKSGRIKMLYLTEKAEAELFGKSVKLQSRRRGGFIHSYWVGKLALLFRNAGFTASSEKAIGGGRTVDIVLEKNGTRYAVEVETGSSDPVFNIRKCLDAGFDNVICVCLNEMVKKKVKMDVEKLGFPLNKVEVLSLDELFKRFRKNNL